jgi:hypothetical protein
MAVSVECSDATPLITRNWPTCHTCAEVTMRADDDLREEIAQLLRRRPGWTLQAVPTPGASQVWCFGSASATELSVTTGTGSIDVYVVQKDETVTLSTAEELVFWLKTHKAAALQDPREGVIHRLKGRTFFRWD